jgi:transcriptional regulator with XRE-family HTH domain
MSFQNIGTALAIVRRKLGLSQAEFAQGCGIGRAQLSRYEAGRELMKLQTLEKMLGQLAVEPEEFFRLVRTLDISPPPPLRRGPSRVDERQLAVAFQNLHAAIDELRRVVERSIDPATRFARLIDEAAATRDATPGNTGP